MENTIFIPSTAKLKNYPYWIINLVPSLPTPGTTDTDFMDTFLAFQKGVLLLIAVFCIIYVFLPHALLFLPASEQQKLLSRL